MHVTGLYTVERNIFSNWTRKGKCGGGEYSQQGASLCYRSMPMIATNTIGGLLNMTYIRGVCANTSAPPIAKKTCVDPKWWAIATGRFIGVLGFRLGSSYLDRSTLLVVLSSMTSMPDRSSCLFPGLAFLSRNWRHRYFPQ